MKNKLIQWLHLEAEPVGIFLGNTAAVCDFDASPDKRNCVIPLLMAASKGRTVSMSEKKLQLSRRRGWMLLRGRLIQNKSEHPQDAVTGLWRSDSAPDAGANEERRAFFLLGRTRVEMAQQHAIL